MMGKARKVLSLALVAIIAVTFIYSVNFTMPDFGTFPTREINGKVENSVGQLYLENATWQTGTANIVTTVVWGYRGYDTLGESTVLFTAVVGVITVLRATRRDE